MSFEQSAVLLQDRSFLQAQAYKFELMKAFTRLCRKSDADTKLALEELDPKYVAIRSSQNLEVNCMLSVYDKKKFTKVKSFGCKYKNGTFEGQKEGWLGTKSLQYAVLQQKDYFLEEKVDPILSYIPWDTNNSYRLILEDQRQTVILGMYSEEEYDLNLVLFNLLHAKIEFEYFSTEEKPKIITFKNVAAPIYKAQQAAGFMSLLMAIFNNAEQFRSHANKDYDSVVDESDNFPARHITGISQMPKLKFETIDSRFDLSQFEHESSRFKESSLHQRASQMANPYTADFKENSTVQKQTNSEGVGFGQSKAMKSILKHPDQGGSRITQYSALSVQGSKSKVVKILEPFEFRESSLDIQSPLPRYEAPKDIAQLDFKKSAMQSQTAKSNVGKSSVPGQVSTIIAIHHQNNELSQLPKTTISETKKDGVRETDSPTSYSSSPSSTSPNRSPTRTTPRIRKQGGNSSKYFTKNVIDLYSTQVRESEVNPSYKSHLRKDYFAPEQISLTKASGLTQNHLVDVKYNFSKVDREKNLGTSLQEEFCLANLELPFSITASKISLDIYSFGLYYAGNDQSVDKKLEIKKVLIKSIEMNTKEIVHSAERNTIFIDVNERIVFENGFTDFIELVLLYDSRTSFLGTKLLSHELFVQLQNYEHAYSIPIISGPAAIMINVTPTTISNNRERKIKSCCSTTKKYVDDLLKIPDLPKKLDEFIMLGIKQRKTELVSSIIDVSFPPNVYLCLWLLVTKKFKPKDQMESSEKKDLVKFKSSIMQSLYMTKQEGSSLEVNNRVSLYFHKLLRELEKRGELANAFFDLKFGTVMEDVKGEYFKSPQNKFKIIDFIFSKIMSDYFNMFVNDKMGSKNILFSHHFRSCSRDYMLLHNYINLYCENIVKFCNLSARDMVIWIVDHILSLNIGILKEQLGSYHLQFLFLMSMKHKDDPSSGYGWRINLYLHIFILQELEDLLEKRLSCYLELGNTLENLYQLVLSDEMFYSRFRHAYLAFEEKIPKIADQATSTLATFFKSVSDTSMMSSLEKAESLYQKMNLNTELRSVFEENVLENILIFQISRMSPKPHKLINLIKVPKVETIRKLAFKIHKIYNKDFIEDDNYFTIECNKEEHFSKENSEFSITTYGTYSPQIELRMHKIGDGLLYKENSTLVGKTKIQLRRHKSNVIHRMLVIDSQ
jgi:hypothetical protein